MALPTLAVWLGGGGGPGVSNKFFMYGTGGVSYVLATLNRF